MPTDYRHGVSSADTDRLALRRLVLAVSVLHDIDVAPQDDGVVLEGTTRIHVLWSQVAEAVCTAPPESLAARCRLLLWLRLRRLVVDLAGAAPEVLRDAARAVALPPGHLWHLGPVWVRERQAGGALDLGLGVLGMLDDPDDVTVLPPTAMTAAGLDTSTWWPDVRGHADRMGALAAERLARDGKGRQAVIRPVGGCDVLTLLASRTLRRHLATEDGSGMRAVAAPMRSRGWYDLARVDPAFVAAAWAATDEPERGVRRPLLVTADEVALARPSGGPVVGDWGVL